MKLINTISILSFGISLVSASTSSLKLDSNELLKSIPTLPLGLFNHLKQQEQSTSPTSTSDNNRDQLTFSNTKTSKYKYKPHFFNQKINHFSNSTSSDNTFSQRYWFDSSYYKPGGPVFLLDAGETSGEGRLPFLESGILRILSEATGGIGVVLEHRYYGESFPFNNLSVQSLEYLTTLQSLHDGNHFATSIIFPDPALKDLDLTANGMGNQHRTSSTRGTAWYYYGGSYAGAKSAFARKLFPEIWWGAIASSAVTTAIVDYWEYMETIRISAPEPCMDLLESHIKLIDQILDLNKPFLTSSLQNYFGLPNITNVKDFVNALSLPLGAWQGRNWDSEISSTGFEEFCEALTSNSTSTSSFSIPSFLSKESLASILPTFPSNPTKTFEEFSRFASFVKSDIATLCPIDLDQNDCFGSDDYAQAGIGLEQSSWRSWSWQVCTEWGYFISAPPKGNPSILSKYIDLEYTSKICKLAFNFEDGTSGVPEVPDVEIINQYGGFELEFPRLAFIDGSEDPWIYATPHSPNAFNPNRKDTTKKPFKLIKGGVHHWDENSRFDGDEPDEIKSIHKEEVEFVKVWMGEWNKRGRWGFNRG